MFVLSVACDPKWIVNLLLVGFSIVRLLVDSTFIQLVTKPAGMRGFGATILCALIDQLRGCVWD